MNKENKKILILRLLCLGLFCLSSAESFAQGRSGSSGGGQWGQRATQREAKRWTLQEWLEQKNRNALMDQWLSMNSPSPFEFYIGLSQSNYDTKTMTTSSTTQQSWSSYQGELAAYAQMIGVSLQHENNSQENYSDLTGMLNFRFLGNSLQTTSLTLSGGQRTRSFGATNTANAIVLKNTLAQAEIQLYITKYFGLDGQYRRYFSTYEASLGDVGGHRTEAGIFIDFKALRIYGNWFEDSQLQRLNDVDTEIKRIGIKSGLRIYF